MSGWERHPYVEKDGGALRAGLLNEGPDWKIRREEERDTL
jgi:hypothetical protein